MTSCADTEPTLAMQADVQFFHNAFAVCLADPGMTVACGRWSDGAILELLPQGQATLLPAAYDGCFAGVRELRLQGLPHHLHIDFGRIHKLSYAVTPSVCLAFKPSFEVRFLVLGPGGAPSDAWIVTLMLSAPYAHNTLDRTQVGNFFERAWQQSTLRPDLVEMRVDPSVKRSAVGPEILALLSKASGLDPSKTNWQAALAAWMPLAQTTSWTPEPWCLMLLHEALALKDASLVIYREKALIEFKTERLDGLHRYEEHGHVSWQIGALDDHHCHLALGAVTKVLFSAESVSCQGGGLNYTVWFLTAGPSGNPYRRDGYFSIVLNRPYDGNAPRQEVVAPVLDLYRRYSSDENVQADTVFLQVLADGPPPRMLQAGEQYAPA